MTIEINKRKFSRDIYDWLKEGEYVVTNHGLPEYVVTVKKVTEEIVAKETIKETISVYGCGCEKGESFTCPKHQRM